MVAQNQGEKRCPSWRSLIFFCVIVPLLEGNLTLTTLGAANAPAVDCACPQLNKRPSIDDLPVPSFSSNNTARLPMMIYSATMPPTNDPSYKQPPQLSPLQPHERLQELLATTRLPSLKEITRSHERNIACNNDELLPIYDKITAADPMVYRNKTYKIPLIIHQTSRSRCMAKKMIGLAKTWKNLTSLQYYFHDDQAVDHMLLNVPHPDFPNLELIVKHCVNSGATKADIWRLVLLWEYGGIYADVDSIPQRFSIKDLRPEDDAFLLVDKDKCPSQFFLALKPRHPIIYITLQSALSALMQVEDTLKYSPVQLTGPAMLRGAFFAYLKWNKVTPPKQTTAGLYHGLHNTTVRIVGTFKDHNDYVMRERYSAAQKGKMYKAMKMSHFKEKMHQSSGESCQMALMRSANELLDKDSRLTR